MVEWPSSVRREPIQNLVLGNERKSRIHNDDLGTKDYHRFLKKNVGKWAKIYIIR